MEPLKKFNLTVLMLSGSILNFIWIAGSEEQAESEFTNEFGKYVKFIYSVEVVK